MSPGNQQREDLAAAIAQLLVPRDPAFEHNLDGVGGVAFGNEIAARADHLDIAAGRLLHKLAVGRAQLEITR